MFFLESYTNDGIFAVHNVNGHLGSNMEAWGGCY